MEAAGTVLEVLSVSSEPYKKLWLEGQGSKERAADAGGSRCGHGRCQEAAAHRHCVAAGTGSKGR